MFPRNVIISNVELNWAKLAKPITNQFGATQYELQIATTDKAHADKISADTGLSFKEKDGKFVMNLKRKAMDSKGAAMTPVRVVDANKAELNGGSIGNGSKGNVIVWQYEYEFAGRKGVGSSLTAVQVTDLVKYERTADVDFDSVSTDAPVEAAPSADLF